jgi:glycosyltransferase involved in cell wall biosynthesis
MVVEQNDRAVKVVVLTTSYPRSPADVSGRFIADAVERLRARGVEVDVVSPADFPHFGLAYGEGIVGNLRRRPWRAAFLPLFLLSFLRAARTASRDADVVHAHWLPSAAIALLTGRPTIAQVWGTDVELARRLPRLARLVLRRATLVVAPSTSLAQATRELGARDVRVIASGVDVPETIGVEDEPPFVLFAGRLSREKGVLELVEAANGIPLVVAGDGPLRNRVPGARGFVPHDQLVRLYDRAAVVAVPSYREGFGVVCAEAMAHGRPVVASAVGGLLDLVVDGETGVHVPPGDVAALRSGLQRLLADPDLRRRMGKAGRARVRERFSWGAVTAATLAVYREASGEGSERGRDTVDRVVR